MRTHMKDYTCGFECGYSCLMRTKAGTCNGLSSPAIRKREDGTQYCAFYKNKSKYSEKELADYEFYLLPIHEGSEEN